MKFKLSEIFDLQIGKTPSRHNSMYWNDGNREWISISDISGSKYISNTKEKITEKAIQDSGIKKIPANTVIMSFKLSIGKVAITSKEMYSNEAIMAFIDKKRVKLLPEYVYYLLMGVKWDQNTNNAVMGKTLNKSTISQIIVDIDDYEIQKQKAEALDFASKQLDIRNKEIHRLDTLVKARFVEMFGDPIKNPRRWKELKIKEGCERILGGGTPSKSHPEYYVGKIPWVTPKDMKKKIIRDSSDHITEEAIENSSTKLIPVGSVLMVIRSGILKHDLPLAINAVPVTINQDMKAFVPKNQILKEYLLYYFYSIESDVLSKVRAVTADNIDFKEFQKRRIPIPPIELQQEFASFVQQVDKSKVVVKEISKFHNINQEVCMNG